MRYCHPSCLAEYPEVSPHAEGSEDARSPPLQERGLDAAGLEKPLAGAVLNTTVQKIVNRLMPRSLFTFKPT